MNVIGAEKITLPVVVITGRHDTITDFERWIGRKKHVSRVVVPNNITHFEDYPATVEGLWSLNLYRRPGELILIETQSAEFLDALLASDLDFEQVTLRVSENEPGVIRLRCLSKTEAKTCRDRFNMELRR